MSDSSTRWLGFSPQAPHGAQGSACWPCGAALLALARGRDSSVLARRGTAGPAIPARTDSQCVGADAPLVCAWNGYGYDGGLNCCTSAGNRAGRTPPAVDRPPASAASVAAAAPRVRGAAAWRRRMRRVARLHRQYQQWGQRRQHDRCWQHPGQRQCLWWHRLQRDGHLGVCGWRNGDRECQWWFGQHRWRRVALEQQHGSGLGLLDRHVQSLRFWSAVLRHLPRSAGRRWRLPIQAADTSEPPAALRSPRRLNRAAAWPGHGGVPHRDPSCDGGGHPRSTRYQYCEIDLNTGRNGHEGGPFGASLSLRIMAIITAD